MNGTDGKRFVGEVIIEPKTASRRTYALMTLLSTIAFTPYYLIWKDNLTLQTLREFIAGNQFWINKALLLGLAVMIAGIIAHEMIHALTWGILAPGKFNTIKLRFDWKEFVPYCHCTDPLPMLHYIAGLAMPGFVLGVVPVLLAYATGNFWLIVFGIFFTAAAASDVLVLQTLKKENINDYLLDHPTATGYQIYKNFH